MTYKHITEVHLSLTMDELITQMRIKQTENSLKIKVEQELDKLKKELIEPQRKQSNP
ncbi:unnamed protein product (macronuclear) [Paramecium tetraurelia]|uniref:Uncharacterized protein n=1 Tax=Paramecium tetraurelia TaxID=5888 RepID=A0E880_PARTE|nr:uncharacterized protein GSPATT00024225001 [Paramecium tetraurelia]CAK91497.1 unnamed protein product [Paramecium tetraurelia]|eukprot:XP_001458894.1 hypothetical protein (macronuclear) [Paramecium tetraurelia strain d4-2]